nr:V-set and transmembrane domain-containing protein 2B-like [Dermacentor andersoni]XP_050050976.1 V-set and transmembrane domain-containing protein 2B-like [Dermacentor andersoni]
MAESQTSGGSAGETNGKTAGVATGSAYKVIVQGTPSVAPVSGSGLPEAAAGAAGAATTTGAAATVASTVSPTSSRHVEVSGRRVRSSESTESSPPSAVSTTLKEDRLSPSSKSDAVLSTGDATTSTAEGGCCSGHAATDE